MKNSLLNNAKFPSQFENMVAEAKLTANFTPLWRGLVRANFLVAIVRRASALSEGFDLVCRSADTSAGLLIIAESKGNLREVGGAELISLPGAEIVRRVPDDVGISIVLSESSFDISAARVAWLKKSLAASQEALKKKADEANAIKAEPEAENRSTISPELVPLPKLHTAPAQSSAPEPDEAVQRQPSFQYQEFEMPAIPAEQNKNAAFNGAAIRKKHVTHSGLGIEMMMPEYWQEARNDKALKLFEAHSGITVEINGRRRDDMSLESWMDARLALVTQQLPGLEGVGDRHDLKGATWPTSMRAQCCEFNGRMNGDEEESHYLICCFETEKRLLVVGILAKQSVFATQRALLIWMLESVGSFELQSTRKSHATLSAPQPDTFHETRAAPSIFSISFSGRIGRARLMVYSLLWALPVALFTLVGILGIMVLKLNEGIYLAALVVLASVMQIRPYVLRLHDLNLGGKWVFIYFALLYLPVLVPRLGLAIWTLIIAVVGVLVLFFVPGSAEENEYGPPNPPNSIWMMLGAILCCVLMIVGSINFYRVMRGQGASLFGKSTASQKSGKGFTPADQSFIIDFPIYPHESDLGSSQSQRVGISEVKIFTSKAGRFNYFVQRLSIPIMPDDKTQAMDAMAESFAKNLAGEVLERSIERINGLVARTMRLRLKNGDYQDFRFLLVKNNLFVLAVQSNSAHGKEPEILNFFASFEVP